MTLASLDRRTRRDVDVAPLTPELFVADHFPPLAERHGALVAAGMKALAAPPLAVEVGGASWSFVDGGGTLAVREGVVAGALAVTLDPETFSDWAQQLLSFNALLVSRSLDYRGGTLRDVSAWDSLWMTLLEGWPVTDDGLRFLDRSGEPLDLATSFTPDDDPADVAHFLREAGFVHLRGWLDPGDMATIADDMDRALPNYVEGDGRSWWATLADGSRGCVRMQEFLGHSPTTEAVLRSGRWQGLRRTLTEGGAYRETPVEGRCVEALIKPVGVAAGPSDLTFHRDCHLGRHAYNCCGVTMGISVTGSDEDNGQLRVVAGSHRVAIPVEVAKADPYLPVVALTTEPGDVTAHLSCTLHEATPPVSATRKVMYGSAFRLGPRDGDLPTGGRALSELRENVYKILTPETEDAPDTQVTPARAR